MNEIEKEVAKLTATYMNGMAIAVFAVGGLAPIFTNIYSASPSGMAPWQIAMISLVCFVGSGGLHWGARRFLRKGLTP